MLTDALTGRVQFTMAPIASSATLAREGRRRGLGVEPAPGTPAELDRFLAAQLRLAAELARKAGIEPQ